MLKSDLLEIITQGEGAKLEFKRDDKRPEVFAKVIVAFANMNGGTILIGVEDDGNISGVQRDNLQVWLMDTVIGKYIHPFILPDYEEMSIDDKHVVILKIPQGNSKPYVFKNKNRENIYIRYGDTCQLAGREAQARLFASGGLLTAEDFPVHGSSINDLDRRRYLEYFKNILPSPPHPPLQEKEWLEMLVNRGFLLSDNHPLCCSYFAYMLFGKQPGLRLPQAVVRFTVYPGENKDYNMDLDETLDQPFLEFRGENSNNDVIEPALHDRLLTRIQPYISKESLHGTIRKRVWDYPLEAIRELILNAFTHRDWTKNNYVRISAYSNRLEIISPGGLPNSMTLAKIKSGAQASRNPKSTRIFRDYGYLEDQGMGIRCKVIPLMCKENGKEPDFEVTEEAFKVTLWKK